MFFKAVEIFKAMVFCKATEILMAVLSEWYEVSNDGKYVIEEYIGKGDDQPLHSCTFIYLLHLFLSM